MGMAGAPLRLLRLHLWGAAAIVCQLHVALAQTDATPTAPPVHDPYADGHLDGGDPDECDKCESHRGIGVAVVVVGIVVFVAGIGGIARGFLRSASLNGRRGDVLNPMLRMSFLPDDGGGDGDEEAGYKIYLPGKNADGSARVAGSAGDGRANRYMSPELRAQVEEIPKERDELAYQADKMKHEGNETYQEAMAMAKGTLERDPLLLAAAELYEFALHKLGNVDDKKRDAKQVVPVWTACHLNLAALYLQVDNPQKAEAHCDEVVSHEKAFHLLHVASFKAHYRRGLARRSLGKLELAVEDLVCARSHSPGDRKLHALCTEMMQQLGKEDFFGVYRVVARAQVKEGVDKSSAFVATLSKGELVSVLDAKQTMVGQMRQMRLHVLPWSSDSLEGVGAAAAAKKPEVRGWTSLQTEGGVRILEKTDTNFWEGGKSPQSWQAYLEEAKAKVSQGLSATQVASAVTDDYQELAKAGASKALKTARAAREKLMAANGATRYLAVKPGVIRQGIDAGTPKVGNLLVDQEVIALEEQGNRIRTDRCVILARLFAVFTFLPLETSNRSSLHPSTTSCT